MPMLSLPLRQKLNIGKESTLLNRNGYRDQMENRCVEKPQELSSLIFFCKQNNFKASLVITIDVSENKTVEDIKIIYVPAAVYAYNIGVNSLEIKSDW